jgi:hypothetical protein
MTSYRYCPECRDERVFEQPPCEDGHDDCPDWICVDCGTGLVIARFAADRPPAPSGAVLPESALLEPASAELALEAPPARPHRRVPAA